MPFGLGLPELVVVLVILLLLFGAKRIPEMASGIGQGIRTFKKALNDEPEQAKKSENVKQIEETSNTKTS
jgi:sec-independent protein translocase protein TatA